MMWLVSIAASLGGRAAIIGSGLAALVGLYALNNHHQRKIGAEKVVAASKEAGKTANAKSETVRREAARPGALRRLQSDRATCVDC